MDTQTLYLAKWKSDLAALGPVRQAVINLTMLNDGFVLQQDEERLMQHIAEHGYIAWQDSNPPIMQATTALLGMDKIGNARAVVDRCKRFGYIKGIVRDGHGRLVLTDVGWQMLELHEMQEEFDQMENL